MRYDFECALRAKFEMMRKYSGLEDIREDVRDCMINAFYRKELYKKYGEMPLVFSNDIREDMLLMARFLPQIKYLDSYVINIINLNKSCSSNYDFKKYNEFLNRFVMLFKHDIYNFANKPKLVNSVKILISKNYEIKDLWDKIIKDCDKNQRDWKRIDDEWVGENFNSYADYENHMMKKMDEMINKARTSGN